MAGKSRFGGTEHSWTKIAYLHVGDGIKFRGMRLTDGLATSLVLRGLVSVAPDAPRPLKTQPRIGELRE
jgi:hypothetical protein